MNSRKPSAAKKQLILAIGILFIGMCLRAPFTSIGPLLEIVQKSLHLSTTAIGLVNALPLLAFATVSPMVPSVSRKLGLELALGMALVLVGGGVLLRSLGHIWSLYMGTVLLGCGIAICNVLLPSLVKQDFPSLIPRLTVAYALSMDISAALGSALVVPLAQSLGWGWELASGSLVLLPLAASAAWLPQLAVRNKNFCKLQMEEPHKVSLWKSALAWQVTLFFGLTSLTYYISVSWLPALLKDAGFTDAGAGNIHGVMQLASAAPGLLLIPVISRMKDQRVIAAAVAGIAALGTAGLAAVPNLAFIWGSCIGFGAGAAIILGLMFIGLRTNNMLQAASLSGMAQGVGYMLAACGPICAGAIHDMTQSWAIVFYGCAGLCVLLGLIGLGAGRDIRVSEDKMAERDGF